MTQRQTTLAILGTPKPNDRPLIAPYSLDGFRTLFKGDTYNQERATFTLPTLVFQGERDVPLYVEAKLHMTPAELDILIGQLHGLRDWIAEPPRDYGADAGFLAEQGIFVQNSDGSFTWADRRSTRRYNSEGAVDAYEAEEMSVADLHEQADGEDDLLEDEN